MKNSLQLITLLCWLVAAQLAGAHPGSTATLDYLSARIAAEPENPSLYHRRGVALTHDGQYRRALADLRLAANLGDPRVVGFHLGIVHFRMNDFAAAREWFDVYLEYQPDHPGALRYRARLLGSAGDPVGALRDYRALFALPGQANPADYLAAAGLMLESSPNDIGGAIALLDLGMERLGTIVQLQHRAIELELARGYHDEAIARHRSLATGAPGDPFWQVEMGRLLLAAGQSDLAYRYFEDAGQHLADLRKTPARLQLALELRGLLTQQPAP